jgi:hypothetical protein
MMSEKDVDKVNEAVEKLTEAVRDSYRAAMENTATVQESNARLARSLFQSNIEALKVQAEIQAKFHSHTLESLAEQVRKNREVFLELSRGSLNAYDGFLDSLSSYYEELSGEIEEPDG